MPRRRNASVDQVAERCHMIREALASCMAPTDIEISFAAEWRVDRRTIRTYMQRVREELIKTKLITMSPDQRAYEQNLVVEGIKNTVALALSRKDARGKGNPDLLRAQHGLDLLGKVYGVYVDRVELSGPGGGPVEIQGNPGLTDKLRKMKADLEAARARAAARMVPPEAPAE